MKIKILFIVLLIINYSFAAFAASIEITTGSQNNEGIQGNSGARLRNGSVVQIIKAAGNIPNPPDKYGKPSSGDTLISEAVIGHNFPFNPDQGKFDVQVWASGGDRIYVRAWDSMQAGLGKRFGESSVYTVKGFDGEVWNIGGKVNSSAFKTSNLIK